MQNRNPLANVPRLISDVWVLEGPRAEMHVGDHY
jgi:hypothetical protein